MKNKTALFSCSFQSIFHCLENTINYADSLYLVAALPKVKDDSCSNRSQYLQLLLPGQNKLHHRNNKSHGQLVLQLRKFSPSKNLQLLYSDQFLHVKRSKPYTPAVQTILKRPNKIYRKNMVPVKTLEHFGK